MERPPRVANSLFVAAPVIYLITVVVGILNGLDLIEFDRNVLMTHVHAGTLGWITLGVIGISLWMFAAPDSKLLRWMAYATIGSVVLFGHYFLGKSKSASPDNRLARLHRDSCMVCVGSP